LDTNTVTLLLSKVRSFVPDVTGPFCSHSLGLRIMSFGVLFDFTGNSNVSKVIPAKTLVQEKWFLDAINYKKPIDLFVVIGHNPVRTNVTSSTFGTLFSTIRNLRPDVPIQTFGGHTHIRDFVVYDNKATGIESGRYCETLGWVAVSGIKSSTCKAPHKPKGVPNPTKKATPTKPAQATGTVSAIVLPTSKSSSTLRYARRYLDWNRVTFNYHATA
jgi:2',3'-cyclic-nucleotide 2'-phosphodiesterase (5'-nucleotidase family)